MISNYIDMKDFVAKVFEIDFVSVGIDLIHLSRGGDKRGLEDIRSPNHTKIICRD
jgi:hypothetical protein